VNTLIGMQEGELLQCLNAGLPSSWRRKIARDKESFVQSLSSAAYDRIVLHTELVADMYPWEWIGMLNGIGDGRNVVIVATEVVYDSLWMEVTARLSAEAGLVVVPGDLGIRDTASAVLRALVEGERSEEERTSPGIVLAVWSAACKDGATTVALNTALALARQTKLRIGLFDMNLKNPELRIMLQLPDPGFSNMSLRPKLQTGSLRTHELWNATLPFRRADNLRILPGTFRRDTAADVSPEMMETLLETSRNVFDVTVLDLSSYPDNAATVCGVRRSDLRWLVAGNRKTSYLWSWSEWYECYWKLCGISPSEIGLVLNRYEPNGEEAERAARSINMPLAGVVPNAKGAAGVRAAETGKPLLDATEDAEFSAGIQSLAGRLANAAGAGPLPEHRPVRRSSLVSLLSGLF